MSSLSSRALVTGLVDDAAVFPPGLAPADVALAEHHQHRAAPYSGVIGPLLVPVAGADAFGRAFAADARPVDVSLIGDATSADAVAGVVETMAGLPPHVHVRAVEVAVPATEEAAHDQANAASDTAARLDAELPDGVLAWVEVRRGRGVADALAALAEGPARVRAKFRTGGTRADAFPSAAELAGVLHAAVRTGVPLKLTAGLHHAVRHTGTETGFAHHGFLNVLAAVADALDGAAESDLARQLDSRDAHSLVERVRDLDGVQTVAVRRAFASFGCCGVTDPVNDLVDLGLLHLEDVS